jgi:DNA-binding MarR family transcriptional regulator
MRSDTPDPAGAAGSDAAASEAASTEAEEAAAERLERAVPMLVRWFTRSDVRHSMLARTDPRLSATDAWLLGRITDTGPVRLSELAEWQEVDRSTMTTQVRRLEDQGLVSRATDPSDGRAVLVRATRKGAARHRRTKETARGVYRELLAGWSEEELEQAARVAARLVETLERRRPPGHSTD